MSEAAHPVRLSARRLRWAKSLALLVMAVSIFHAVVYGLSALPFDKGFSRLGLNVSATASEGYVQVERTPPGGVAAAAGIAVGDWVRFDRPTDVLRLQVRPGETLASAFATATPFARRFSPLRHQAPTPFELNR